MPLPSKTILVARPSTRKLLKQSREFGFKVVRVRCEMCGLAAIISQSGFETLERLQREGREFEVRCDRCVEKEPVGEGGMSEEGQKELEAVADRLAIEVRRN